MATLLILVSGWVVVLVVGLGLGFLAKHVESSVDKPILRWVDARVTENVITRLAEKFTYMGNTPIIEVTCTIAVILLACAYRSRWWLPTLAIVVAFVDEKVLQKVLSKVVDRGHPPTTLGTYPSGGCFVCSRSTASWCSWRSCLFPHEPRVARRLWTAS